MVPAGIWAKPTGNWAGWNASRRRQNGSSCVNGYRDGGLRRSIGRTNHGELAGRPGPIWFWRRGHPEVGPRASDCPLRHRNSSHHGVVFRRNVAGCGCHRVCWL